MVRKTIQIHASITFTDNMRKLFPHTKSDRERTERLNKIIEELLYGKKKNK